MKPPPAAPRKSPSPAASGATAKAPATKARARKTPLMPRANIRPFLDALRQANPDVMSELSFTDPFTLLVSVVLSAQTTDAAVNRATPALFAEAPTPEAMARMPVERVAHHIRSIGLWQAKARNVVALSKLLVERHDGVVPGEREALEALPGVGRKTANVVLNIAFGVDAMAVDTHVFRLGNRTGIAPGKTPRAVEDGLVERVPREMLRPAHFWLILHGRYVCKARLPECWRCVARDWCCFPDKVAAPPARPARRAVEAVP